MKSKLFNFLLTSAALIILVTAVAAQAGEWSHVSVDGAGASFPYPIYSLWAYEYEEITGMKLNYQSVGSGAGISAIQSNMVHFGASDKPLTGDVLDEYGLIQFPMIIGGVVPVINVPGITVGQLKLTEDALAGIFLGVITNWNDPEITSANPGMNIPDKAIVVVHRADGSGTTWIFSNYMSAISGEWADTVGIGKSLDWPVGIGGRGNEGVANYIMQVDGAIGYVEYAYALQGNLTYCRLENKDGNFVDPTADNFADAAAHAEWENAVGYYMVLVVEMVEETWADNVVCDGSYVW
jgi:phosphate transport system substrate-binding protein